MNPKIQILLLFCFYGTLSAQPDENYIKKLTGEIKNEWLTSVGNSVKSQQLQWSTKRAPGFNNTDISARKLAILSQPWSFYKIDTTGSVGKAEDIKFPHKFNLNRDYKSGWYFIKYQLDKSSDKRYILLLDRIQMFSMVYVNGNRCVHHFGGTTPFETDITDALVPGINVLAIFVYDQNSTIDGNKAYNQLGTTRLRSVYNPTAAKELPGGVDCVPTIEVREKAYIRDIFVKTSTRKGEMEIEYELYSNTDISSDSKLSFELFKWPDGKKVNLEIPSVPLNKSANGINTCIVKWSDPELWSPDHPELYVLRTSFQNGKNKDLLDTRFGFREFWIEGKSFMLNGSPIRLRGESYYSPVLTGRDFHREAFRVHKRLFGSNACRLHAFMPPGDVVLGADEAGVLLIDQSAIWSESASYYRNGGEWFLKNTEKEFEEWARRDRNSPSVVIWDVENEMLRISFDLHLPWVSKLNGFIEKFDNTRSFNNSGAGWFSHDQDMVLLHMQEHYTKITSDWIAKGTNPLINGEFWVGGRAEERLPNSPELKTAAQRFTEEGKIYEEKLLEMRYMGVSGVMPFRISQVAFLQRRNAEGYNFSPPDKLDIHIRSDEGIQRIRHGLQPETVFFWPRQFYAPSGNNLKRELVICNDGETTGSFEVTWKWDNETGKSQTISLQPTEQKRIIINEDPQVNARKLIAILSKNNSIISSDTLLISPITIPKVNVSKNIVIYNDATLSKTLNDAGIKSVSENTIPKDISNVLLIIPEHANTRELILHKDKIMTFLKNGGTILCLKQDQSPTWFPVKFHFWSANQTSPHNYALMGWAGLNKNLFFSTEAPILASSHPIFAGINSEALHQWDKFDGRVSDDVFARPAIINKYEMGNWRPLASGTRREHISLSEIFYGKGTMISCQLNVIDNLDNVQAKTLFVNMLNYLSDKKPESLNNRITLRGSLKETDISVLTGAPAKVFKGASSQKHHLMIASDGADISEIKEWASNGGKVIVFSNKISQLFDGIKFSSSSQKLYYATKISDHSLLYGVSSANFLDATIPVISGYFTSVPSQAKILLQGFSTDKSKNQAKLNDLWSIEDAGPIMISIPFGKGEILLSTVEFKIPASTSSNELLSLILTNAGIELPYNQISIDEIAIKKTVPLILDGNLKDWTEDMEDRLVTKFTHAQPVYLTSESIVVGPPEFDLNLSAINYFMWNEQALYISGVVFSEEKTFEAGVSYGSKKEYKLDILYNKDIINIAYKDNEAKILVNGKTNNNVVIKTSQISSKNLTDASVLQFNLILKSGKIETIESLIGETFEVMIPWENLTSAHTNETAKAFITIESKGSKLQVPFISNQKNEESWLNMKLKSNMK